MSKHQPIGLAVALGTGVLLAGGAVAERLALRGGVALDWGGPIMDPVSTGRVDGFSVAAGATELEDTDAPALFAAMDRGEWLAAIRLLETLGEGEADTLIRDHTGMLRPLTTLREQVLADLPAEGRRTFRTMYDPLADKLLRDALATPDEEAQQALLVELVEGYALCEAAAAGADRLGDLHFERGRFAEAARQYALAAAHADSRPDDAGLMAKRLHAMARGGDWAGFDQLAEYARFRRGSARVRIAGEDRTLADVIDTLAEGRGGGDDRPTLDTGPALRVPADPYPAVDLELIDDRTASMVQLAIANQGVPGSAGEMLRPSVASHAGRVYVSWLSQVVALDPATGQTLWSQGNAQDTAQQITGQAWGLRQGYHQSLQVVGDHVVATMHQPTNIYLAEAVVLDTATGERRWSTRASNAQHNRGVIGRPTVAGNTMYVVTKEQSGNRLVLQALNMLDGGEQWSMDLGQAAIDPDWGEPRGVEPRIAVGDRYVMVLTNNGALVAVDPVRQQVGWAMTTGMLPGPGRHNPYAAPTQPGGLAVVDGLVVSKDTRDDQLVAIREADAVRVWSVQVDPGATLVHTDSRHAYLLGEELVAYDLRTGERVWWTRHHGHAGQSPAFTATHALVAGSQRLCRIDLANGKVDGYREDIPAGSAGSPTVRVRGGVAIVGMTGLRIYVTDED